MDTVTLEKFKYVVMLAIPKDLLNEFAIPPDIRISEHFDWIGEAYAVQIRQEIFGEHLEKINIQYAADWWQALKEEHAPDWFLRRWPVRYIVHHVDVRALYPKISIPQQPYRIHVSHQKWETLDDGA